MNALQKCRAFIFADFNQEELQMKSSIKTILISTLACCVLVSATGCSAPQETVNTSSSTSSVSSQAEEGEETLEAYVAANPEVLDQLRGTDENVSVIVIDNNIRYTYRLPEDALTGDETADRNIVDSVMASVEDTFQTLTDTLAESTGLPIQMDVIYENTEGETIGAYSYVSAEIGN